MPQRGLLENRFESCAKLPCSSTIKLVQGRTYLKTRQPRLILGMSPSIGQPGNRMTSISEGRAGRSEREGGGVTPYSQAIPRNKNSGDSLPWLPSRSWIVVVEPKRS